MSQPGGSTEFCVEAASPGGLSVLLPLMQQIEPALTLRDWLGYAMPLVRRCRGQSGILIVRRRARNHPCGAVCYRRERDLRFGYCLTAQHLVALDLLRPERLITMLLSALDALAVERGCQAVRAIVWQSASGFAGGILDDQHTTDGIVLLRQVTHAMAAR